MPLTAENILFIKENRQKMSGSDMAKIFGVSKSVVNRYMHKNGLAISKELHGKFIGLANNGKTSSTSEIDVLLKSEYMEIPVKGLAKKIGRSGTFVRNRLNQLNLIIPAELIEQRKKNSRIKPGNVPANKGKKQIEYMTHESIKKTEATRFKPGNKPSNTKQGTGHISIRKDKSGREYKYVKIADCDWQLLQRVNYVKKYGRIPKGIMVTFKDGNRFNCEVDNLMLMSMKANMKRNSIHRYPKSILKSIRLLSKLNKKIKYAQK